MPLHLGGYNTISVLFPPYSPKKLKKIIYSNKLNNLLVIIADCRLGLEYRGCKCSLVIDRC